MTFIKKITKILMLLSILVPTLVRSQEKDFTKINDPTKIESLKKNLFLEAVSEPENGLVYELYLDLDKKTDHIKGVFRTGDEQPLYYNMDNIINRKEISICHSFFDTMYLGIDKNFSKENGGTLYLKYVHNMFSFRNQFKTHSFDLRKSDNIWQLYSNTEKNKTIDRVTLKSNFKIGQLVGVKNIEE